MTLRLSEAYWLIAEYAIRQGWKPIGFRSFAVGPWKITVNGTKEQKDNIDPFHALVEHKDYVGLMMLSPAAGSVAGWRGTELDFIEAMRTALQSGGDTA